MVGLRGQQPPDRVRIEARVGGGDQEDGADESDRGDAEFDPGEVLQLHIGDDNAKEVDLHHRPGLDLLHKPEARHQPAGAPSKLHRDQDRDHPENLHQGHDDPREPDGDRERPHAFAIEGLGAVEDGRGVGLTLDRHGHDREGIGH